MTDEAGRKLKEIRIGTSGYSYKGWVGPFYPPGLPTQMMLPFYERQFDTVEINYTYYRMPTERSMAGMVEKTGDRFSFFIKAHQSATHERDLSGTQEFLGALRPMREAGKLAGVLFQFPQSFRNAAENRAYLNAVARQFAGLTLAVEFRDRSWASEAVYGFLESNNLNLVAVDEPQISTLFPPLGRATGDVGYLRLHSRDGSKWYGAGGERYDYDYSAAELREWLPRLKEIARRASRLYIYFNNCYRGQAARNARAFEKILGKGILWEQE